MGQSPLEGRGLSALAKMGVRDSDTEVTMVGYQPKGGIEGDLVGRVRRGPHVGVTQPSSVKRSTTWRTC